MLTTAHIVVVVGATVLVSVAMLVAVIGRLRIRKPLLVWRNGLLTGIPIGPLLFLCGVAAGFGATYALGYTISPILALSYPALGVFWFIAVWHARTVVVTEYGLIHDVQQISTAIPWGQIVDYTATPTDNGTHFIFFYQSHRSNTSRQRLDLQVPADSVDVFQEIVARKLDDRFAFSVKEAYSNTPAER